MQVAVKSVEEETSSWESMVSGWLDGEGEIRSEDLDSPYGRQLWDTYHLIGDVLRSEDLAIKPSDLFYARISKAIDAEPTVLAPARHKASTVRRGLSGLAIAAAVVTVVWVAMPYFSTGDSGAGQVQVVASTADDVGLRDYVDAHRQFAGVNPVRQVSFDAGAFR